MARSPSAPGGHPFDSPSRGSNEVDTFSLLVNEFGDSVNVLIYENDEMNRP